MSISAKANSVTYTLAESSECLKAGMTIVRKTATKGTSTLTQAITLPTGTASIKAVSVKVEGGYCLSVAAGYSSHTLSGSVLTVTYMLSTERTDSPNVSVCFRYFYV